jgi:hypothetical protein
VLPRQRRQDRHPAPRASEPRRSTRRPGSRAGGPGRPENPGQSPTPTLAAGSRSSCPQRPSPRSHTGRSRRRPPALRSPSAQFSCAATRHSPHPTTRRSPGSHTHQATELATRNRRQFPARVRPGRSRFAARVVVACRPARWLRGSTSDLPWRVPGAEARPRKRGSR